MQTDYRTPISRRRSRKPKSKSPILASFVESSLLFRVTAVGRIFAPTNPRRSRPVRPRPSQLCLSALLRISIFSCGSSSVCTLARTLTHWSMRPTVSVMRWEVSGAEGRWMMVGRWAGEKDWKINWSGFEDVFDAARLRLPLIESEE